MPRLRCGVAAGLRGRGDAVQELRLRHLQVGASGLLPPLQERQHVQLGHGGGKSLDVMAPRTFTELKGKRVPARLNARTMATVSPMRRVLGEHPFR